MTLPCPIARLALAGLCVTACSVDRSAVPRQPERVPPAAPTIDGSREACVLPPFVPAEDETILADGTRLTRASGRQRWTLILNPGAPAATREDLHRGAERLRTEHDLPRAHRNHCDPIGGPPSSECWSVWLPLCTTPLDDVVTKLRAAAQADPRLSDRSIPVEIELIGRLRPRCNADDPGCTPVPEPHGGGGFYDPTGKRTVIATEAVGTCEHDGDCVVSGCHEQTCSAWDIGADTGYGCLLGISPLACGSDFPDAPPCNNACRSFNNGGGPIAAEMCDDQQPPSRVFCGCVDRQCVWFDQG